MKFSEKTLQILKNFSSINPSVIMFPGKEIRTINTSKSIMGVASIEEEIPSKACIYDLSKFLSIIALYEDPELEFEESYFNIKEGRKKTKYFFADESMIFAPPTSEIKEKECEVEVNLTWKDFESVTKASRLLGFKEIAFIGEDGKLSLRALDSNQKNKSSDFYDVELGDTDKDFRYVISLENVKFLPSDYKVQLRKTSAKFENEKISYYVAIETSN